jgi:hypothetical protein
MTFKKLLNSPFNVGLFVTTSMILFLAIIEPSNLAILVCWLIFAFLLPVEFEVNISRCRGNWILIINKFDNRLEHILIGYTLHLRIKMEVLSANSERHFYQTLNILRWESRFSLSSSFHKLESDVVVFILLSSFVGVGGRGCGHFSCETHL